jgi:hypothetical protein
MSTRSRRHASRKLRTRLPRPQLQDHHPHPVTASPAFTGRECQNEPHDQRDCDRHATDVDQYEQLQSLVFLPLACDC